MNWIRLKLPPEHVADGLDRHRLGEAGNALEQDVAVGEQRHEHALQHLLLPDDHPLDLEEGRLEGVADLFGASDGVEPPLLVSIVTDAPFWSGGAPLPERATGNCKRSRGLRSASF